MKAITKLLLVSSLSCIMLGAHAGTLPDAFALWQRGAFRGANVMQKQCTMEDLRVLRSWGANLAEIPVSNVYAPVPPYAFQPENLAKLDQAVKAAEEAGLYVALTCREGPGRPDFNRSHEIWQEVPAQDAYAKMWREIAAHYRGRASIVGYDLMCEPHPDQYAKERLGDWNALAKKITAAIREVDHDTPILVNSIGWAYPQQFEVLQLTGDPRTVYTVHFYDPHYYTHQKPADKVVYPGFRVPGKQAPWDKATIEAQLAPVRAFQQKHQVPIFVGEFGCARYAPGVEDWMRDQINLYENYGWSWAYWAFREWDVMNIERAADPADKSNHADAPLLRLFKAYFAKDKDFPLAAGTGSAGAPAGVFVRVSPRDPRYFELSDGKPYIPIGLNMIAPPGNEGLPGMEAWLEQLQANGGNYIRVWLGNPFFDVEHTRSGEYDEAKAERIEAMLTLAARHGIRVKMCLEHFRHLGNGRQAWAAKPLHLVANGGTATNMSDFFNGAAGREQFKKKLAWFAQRFGDNPTVFGWELWNEINAVQGGDYLGWTEIMLPELHRLFPHNLAMQSLGSYDGDHARPAYRRLATMPGNDVAQVHRYLDLGARFEVCHGPVDLLAADAVRELLSCSPGRPVLLAESGAVEPSHSGPFKLYNQDTNGVLLHDVLFTPFFTGAAGPGHIWHWDYYVAKQNLWWQFGRFAEAVKDIDPPAEHFQPELLPHSRLRVYALKGEHTVLCWCRDTQNTWRSELADAKPPDQIEGAVLDLSPLKANAVSARFYDPWENRWMTATVNGTRLSLPVFKRSLVVRLAL